MMRDTHLFALPNVSQAGMEPAVVGWQWQWQWQLTSFLSVTWHGEAFHGLGVQAIEVLILVGRLFLPCVAPACQQDFGVTELTLSASVS
jgi:hypothetical protein